MVLNGAVFTIFATLAADLVDKFFMSLYYLSSYHFKVTALIKSTSKVALAAW